MAMFGMVENQWQYNLYKGPFSTQENFPCKENFVKYDWWTQSFCWKKIFKLTIFNF
jgi:hypothetical protein